MKNYQHWSLDDLKEKKKFLLDDIDEWNRILKESKSKLIQLLLTHYIKKAQEEIHAINAELLYRNAFHIRY